MKENRFRAGAARREITPGTEILPIPFVFSYVIDGVADSLFVRVLYLDDGQKRILFITFDMGIVPYAEETLQFVAKLTGLQRENIFMSATHTHEVPVIGADIPEMHGAHGKDRLWYARIQTALREAIEEAKQKKRNARIGYGEGKSYININRDELKDGKGGEPGNNFERPSDKTLSLVRIEDEDGKIIALIVNYAVHAVVMNGCSVHNKVQISGDLPGRTSTMLEEQFDGATVLWTSGAAGDQNPRIMTAYGAEIENGQIKVKSLGEAGYMILDFLVKEHVSDILEVNNELMCDEEEIKIETSERIVRCPARKQKSVDGAVYNQSDAESGDKKVTYTLRMLKVGDLVFEGVSAEVVTTIGAALKQASPYEKTIVVTHVNNYCGYVPDDWEYEHNAFEAAGTPVMKGFAQPAFIQAFSEMFDEMN
ncbi:neutral/alkaline non-lysosomal ceramidase N-terminal domain-containing protein [Robinsoniella peoriensis]